MITDTRERERDKRDEKKKSNKKRALESLLQKIVSVSLLFSKTIEIETRFSRHTKEEED